MANPPKVILLYGAPGSGKTTAIAELAQKHNFGDVYFVNMDMDGIDSVYDKERNLMPGVHHSTMIRTIAELQTEWQNLKARRNIPPTVKTIAFDSFSIIDFRVMNFVADNGGKPTEIGKMNQQKWGQRAQLINNHITSAFDLPFDFVIFTAHEKYERNDDGQATMIYPSVGSENSRAIGEGAFSCVVNLKKINKTKRQLTFNNNPVIVAKCRSKAIEAMLNDQGSTDKPLHEVLSKL